MKSRLDSHVSRINRICQSAANGSAASERTIEHWVDRFVEAPAWIRWAALALFPLTLALIAVGLALLTFQWVALFLSEATAATRNEVKLHRMGSETKPGG